MGSSISSMLRPQCQPSTLCTPIKLPPLLAPGFWLLAPSPDERELIPTGNNRGREASIEYSSYAFH
jgi:hypothetical protein